MIKNKMTIIKKINKMMKKMKLKSNQNKMK